MVTTPGTSLDNDVRTARLPYHNLGGALVGPVGDRMNLAKRCKTLAGNLVRGLGGVVAKVDDL